MKKNFLLFICVLLCAALLAAVITACNDEDGTQTVKPGGEGQTGEELPDGGLVFELASDGESYAVADYTGTSTEVEIPSVHEGLPVTSIGQYAFRGCSGLTSVIIPDTVTRIGDFAFEDCSSLTSVTIPNSVTSIGWSAFSGCSGLTSVYITDLVAWCGIEFGGSYANPLSYAHNLYLNGELGTELVIPDGMTSIGQYAFSGCTAEIVWGDDPGITEIGEYAFYGYKGTSITIPDSVASIGPYAFAYCTELTSVTIPNGVTSIGDSAFSGCRGLTSVTIPDRVTGIGDSAFYCCYGLTSVTIGDSVTSIGIYAFLGCAKLVEVYNKSTLDIKSGSTFIRKRAARGLRIRRTVSVSSMTASKDI